MNGSGNQPLAAGLTGARPLEAANFSSVPGRTVFTVTGSGFSPSSVSGMVFSTTREPMVMRSVAIEKAVRLRATV